MKSQEELKENIVALINLWFNDYNDDSDDVLSNNIIDLFDLQNAKLVEENERYKDFHDNWFNVATDYLKLKEENERLNKVNLIKNNLTDELSVLSTKYAVEISELQSELTQAKERIEGLTKERDGYKSSMLSSERFRIIDASSHIDESNLLREKIKQLEQWKSEAIFVSGQWDKVLEWGQNHPNGKVGDNLPEFVLNQLQSLESKCKGLEEKQIGFAEWLMEKGYLPLLRKITKEKVRFRIDELYAIYSQTLLNG